MKEVRVAAIINSAPLGGFQKRVILLCTLLAFVEGFDAQNAGFVAPALAKAFSLAPASLGLFFSLGLMGLMFGALLVAPIADRLGRKPIILISLAVFGLGSLGMAASPSVPMLLVCRFITGFGLGGAMPNVIAMSSEVVPTRIRSLIVTMVFSGFTVGAIVAGLFASRMIGAFGWPSVFIAGGVSPLLLLPVVAAFLPESLLYMAKLPGAQSRLRAHLEKIDSSLIGRTDLTFRDDGPAPAIAVGALFARGRATRTLLLWIIFFCSLLDLFLLTTWLPTQMRSLGFSNETAILLGTLLQVGALAGMALGWVIDRVGHGLTLFLSYTVGALALAAIGLVGANLPLLTVSVFLAGFGVVGSQVAANAVSVAAYPTEARSTGVGWALGVGRLGSIIGPGLAGVLLGLHVANRDIFFLAVGPMICAALASLALARRPESSE
jgi:AAHS family 4-hydroxybenzoate transporter-like MFS transporter